MQYHANDWRVLSARSIRTNEWRTVSVRHVVVDVMSWRACSHDEMRVDNGLRGR